LADGNSEINRHANFPYSETESGIESPRGIAGEVKAKLGEIAEPLKDKAEALAQEQMEAGTGHMRSLASAVHGAARELEAGLPRIATSVHDVAAKIEQLPTISATTTSKSCTKNSTVMAGTDRR
jgi:methyl-accepting chemotaxis protein